jgi:sugar phosphate isomerase/epimerase
VVGIFSKTYKGGSLEDVFARAVRDGYRAVHFNFSAVGLPSLPPKLERMTCERVALTAAAFGLRIVGVSATYNMIHPSVQRRRAQTRSAQRVIELAPLLGTNLVTLCTGSRDPTNMWRAHPENAGARAWDDLVETIEQLRISAGNAGVTLGIEPEPGNVVSSPSCAYELLVTHGPQNLGIVLDMANLLGASNRHCQASFMSEAVDLLAPWLAVIHAKDRDDDGRYCPPGAGWVDWDLCFSLLAARSYRGPVVVHDIGEAESRRAHSFLVGSIEEQFSPALSEKLA